MTFCLKTLIIKPEKNLSINNAIILLHGYGGGGEDISMLTLNWKRFLPNTVFLCPDGPETCTINPVGFQWFDLLDQSQEQILSKSLIAEKKLNKFIDEVKDNNGISAEKISLSGFSQGCMLVLQTGIKRKDKINSIIGYSGKILDTEHLSKNINSRPKITLMHGEKDQVVTIEAFLEAKDFFRKNDYTIESQIFKNCEHRIPTEGSSLGLQFIKKHFK